MRYVYSISSFCVDLANVCVCRCDIDPNRVAVWYSPKHRLRLSACAAQVLAEAGELDISQLKLHRKLLAFLVHNVF